MPVLLDTNIVLNVLLNRQPWVTESAAVWQANDRGQLVAYIVASALTDIFYVACRLTNLETAHKAVRLCLGAFEICTVDRQALEHAQNLPGNDFEDKLQIACAEIAGLDAIVTRDSAGFKAASVSVLSPAELLARLK